jgi:hypothetical protein
MQDINEAKVLLSKAISYQIEGFEGKARVTSRLAVAAALQTLYTEWKLALPQGSALDLIKSASSCSSLPYDQQQLLQHFTQKVGENYHLPEEMDLLADAQMFIQWVNFQLNGAKES